jgi:hypothetical protein
MFESRHQTAQFCLAFGGLFAVLAVASFLSRSILLGVTCLIIEHAAAAVGCALYAGAKGYSSVIGIPVGIGLGAMGGVVMAVLPDETVEDPFDDPDRDASEAIKNARQRDPGYEVLDDDE